jgi:ketosteroid isomerase-like protein
MVDAMAGAFQPGDTVSVARRLFELFSAGGTEAMAEMLAPDVQARPGIAGSPLLNGRAAVQDWWADTARRGTELEARPLDFELQGDRVIVRGYLRHRDGRTLAENQVFWALQVRDGLVTRMESYPSRTTALAAAA